MRLGVILPQTEIGDDPATIREYATRVEGAGLDHIAVYDHVLGADPAQHPGWSGPYTFETPFHEVFVLLAHLAAVTTRVELVTEVLVLPQRQAALVAKQAAELDLLSGQRLRLGVGIGWNAVEFEALGEDFATRAARFEEQIVVMRRLWAEDVVTFAGRFHRITAAGIRPRPRRSIPIWIGAAAEPAMRRGACIADGWMLNIAVRGAGPRIEQMRTMVAAAGRDPGGFGISGRVTLRDDVDASIRRAHEWERLGATHLSLNTMGEGLAPSEHASRVLTFLEAWRRG